MRWIAGILYQIIRHIKHSIHTVRWVTYHLFDVGLKTGGLASKFLSLVFDYNFPRLTNSHVVVVLLHRSLISRLAEFSNVTEYVICIFTFSSVHTAERDVYIQQGLQVFFFLHRTRAKISKQAREKSSLLRNPHTYIYSYIKGKNPNMKGWFCVLSCRCFCAPLCDISKRVSEK